MNRFKKISTLIVANLLWVRALAAGQGVDPHLECYSDQTRSTPAKQKNYAFYLDTSCNLLAEVD